MTSKIRVGFAAVIVAFCFWAGFRLFPLAWFAITPHSVQPQVTEMVQIPSGQTPRLLATLLEQKGIISNAQRFHRLGIYLREWNSLKAGEYRLSSSQSPIEIFSVITSGVSVGYRITIPEGSNMHQIGALLEGQKLALKKDFVSLCRDREFMKELGFVAPLPISLEGYLYPETYFFNRTLSPRAMVKQMVQNFMNRWTPEFDSRAAELGLTQNQVVTLASIIEKETGAPEERPLISSVFHNRIRKGMRLQSDPTTIYGIWERYDGNIRKKDLLEPSPFNTYTIAKLPVGAIANPGLMAIQAALFPEKSDYLYFVSKNNGRHVFTSSLKDHLAAVRDFQLNRRAREGKSWRDLKPGSPNGNNKQ